MDDGQNLGPKPAISGQFLRLAETEEGFASNKKPPGKHEVSAVFQGVEPDRSKVEAAGIEPASLSPQATIGKVVAQTPSDALAQTLARESPSDPDLALILERWPTLPEAIRAGILAMVRAAGEQPALRIRPVTGRVP